MSDKGLIFTLCFLVVGFICDIFFLCVPFYWPVLYFCEIYLRLYAHRRFLTACYFVIVHLLLPCTLILGFITVLVVYQKLDAMLSV